MLQKPIKVVHYKDTFPQLTENWLYNQISGLDKNFTRVYTVERGDTDSFPFDNIRCLREDISYFPLLFNRACNKFFHRHPRFFLWLWKDAPHLIHAHFGTCGYDMLPYARWFNIPLVTSFYGYDAYQIPQIWPWWRDRYKTLFRRGRLFLAEGPVMRQKLIELGCPPEKIVVHHIGIKSAKYEFHVRKPDNEVRLLICGRFVEKKGIPYAIEALNLLKSKVTSKVHLTIVGDSDEKGTLTEEKRRILNLIERYKITDAVTITGYIPHSELIKLIYKHHICLAPSVHACAGDAEGGFPVILTEVLATGMPVVAFNHCDIPYIVQDGKSGFIVQERDTDAFAERLAYLIEHPQIWPKMGSAGRSYVEANYDINKLNDRLVEIYGQLLKDSKVNSR